MEFIQSNLRKMLLALVAIAGPADVSMFDVPRLVAQARASQAPAPSISGTWEGTTGQGRHVSLLLNAEGTTLTGWITLDTQSGAVEDGKLEKNTVTFRAVIGGRTLTFNGDVGGDEMTVRLEGAQNPVTLKRSK